MNRPYKTKEIKKEIQESDDELIGLEADREISQVIALAGSVAMLDPSKQQQVENALAASIVEIKNRTKREKAIKARMKAKEFYEYDYDTKIFRIRLNGKWESLPPFTTKRKKMNQSTLFEILLEHWEKNGWMPILLTQIDIEAKKRLSNNWYPKWFDYTFRHLQVNVQKKPELAKYVEFIRIESTKGVNTGKIVVKITNPNV